MKIKNSSLIPIGFIGMLCKYFYKGYLILLTVDFINIDKFLLVDSTMSTSIFFTVILYYINLLIYYIFRIIFETNYDCNRGEK